MLKYLVVNHILYETFFLSEITKTDLIDLVKGDCKAVIDIENKTMFDAKNNQWIPVPVGKEYRS